MRYESLKTQFENQVTVQKISCPLYSQQSIEWQTRPLHCLW